MEVKKKFGDIFVIYIYIHTYIHTHIYKIGNERRISYRKKWTDLGTKGTQKTRGSIIEIFRWSQMFFSIKREWLYLNIQWRRCYLKVLENYSLSVCLCVTVWNLVPEILIRIECWWILTVWHMKLILYE